MTQHVRPSPVMLLSNISSSATSGCSTSSLGLCQCSWESNKGDPSIRVTAIYIVYRCLSPADDRHCTEDVKLQI